MVLDTLEASPPKSSSDRHGRADLAVPADGEGAGGVESQGHGPQALPVLAAVGMDAGRRFPSAFGQGKGLACCLATYVIIPEETELETWKTPVPFWCGLSLCWDFSTSRGE